MKKEFVDATPEFSHFVDPHPGLGVLALVLSNVVVPAGVGAASASIPAIQITPNHGPWFTVTVVTGQGFAPNEQVGIYKQTRPFLPTKPTAPAVSLARRTL